MYQRKTMNLVQNIHPWMYINLSVLILSLKIHGNNQMILISMKIIFACRLWLQPLVLLFCTLDTSLQSGQQVTKFYKMFVDTNFGVFLTYLLMKRTCYTCSFYQGGEGTLGCFLFDELLLNLIGWVISS